MFHYNKALRRNLTSFCLYKTEFKEETNQILKLLGSLPFKIHNNDNLLNDTIIEISKKYNIKILLNIFNHNGQNIFKKNIY